MADASGTTVWKWDQQEPFGNNTADENPSGVGTFDLPLRLPGQYFDKETNLHYNYFRDYDPSLGSYKQFDPIGLRGGINGYAYVLANPLSLSDPTGEIGLAGLIVGGAVILAGSAYFGYQAIGTIASGVQFGNTLVQGPQLQALMQAAFDACQCGNQEACTRLTALRAQYLQSVVGGATNAGANLSNVQGGGPLPGQIGGAGRQLYQSR